MSAKLTKRKTKLPPQKPRTWANGTRRRDNSFTQNINKNSRTYIT